MMSEPEANPVKPADEKGVLCAKCDHLNPPGSNVCEECEAHLHVSCHACGHRNRRVDAVCSHCGHHLHRSLGRRLMKKLMPHNRTIILVEAGLLLILVLVAYKIIIKLVE
jgi:hypothetical protein